MIAILLMKIVHQGHTALLAWLASRLGAELEQALGDENKQGLDPTTIAIKVRIVMNYVCFESCWTS